ncbi:hypothetical protein ABZ379_22060 [Streptomyces canus]|uniref:hypothetical protein n=1 Tax=Streptomyces canus TaxID=58343 RepID=UPI0033F9FD13
MFDSSLGRRPDAAQERAQPGRPRGDGRQTPRHHRRPGIPLAGSLTGANLNGITQLPSLVDKV